MEALASRDGTSRCRGADATSAGHGVVPTLRGLGPPPPPVPRCDFVARLAHVLLRGVEGRIVTGTGTQPPCMAAAAIPWAPPALPGTAAAPVVESQPSRPAVALARRRC